MAIPIIYTNRAAFDAAVGPSTLLTLDAADPAPTPNFNGGVFTATYSNLFKVIYDASVYNPQTPGGAPLEVAILGAGGFVSVASPMQPVTAFGFDIVPGGSNTATIQFNNSFAISVAGLNFFGVKSDTPFSSSVQSGPDPNGGPSRVVIDNVAIKTATTTAGVPPPTGLTVK